jgi:alkylation response protein AidB-like acyl-CoA dehydrogenase
MDFDLSEDQLALRDGARALLDDLAPTTRVRAVAETPERWDRELWAAMVDQGWLGIATPEAQGGVGLGWVELAVLLEEIGRHVAPAPFLHGPRGRDRSPGRRLGDGQQLLLGSRSRAWRSRRPGAVRADRDGQLDRANRPDRYPCVGRPARVRRGAPTTGRLFVVDLGAIGRPSPAGHGPPGQSPGWTWTTLRPDSGGPGLVTALLDATPLRCARDARRGRGRGDGRRMREGAVQFGRPIGSFQAVKHRCADMLVDVEGMRSTAYWAAWCLGADDPDQSIAASTAKTWGSDASKRVMASALQVHGGIGFTWEHDLHLFLKRAQLDQLSFGARSSTGAARRPAPRRWRRRNRP